VKWESVARESRQDVKIKKERDVKRRTAAKRRNID
jgi:hypothetical protein